MGNKIILLAGLLLGFADVCLAGDPVYTCQACRRPGPNHIDFGNFAFNAVFGANPTIGLAPGMLKYTQPLQIENRFGQIVNVWFRNMVGFSETMTIRLEKPNGEVVDYRIMKSRIGSDLRVGRQVTNGGGAGAGSQGSGSGSSGSGTGSGDPPGGEVICGNSQVDDGPQRRTCMRR